MIGKIIVGIAIFFILFGVITMIAYDAWGFGIFSIVLGIFLIIVVIKSLPKEITVYVKK